jgi:hypothetical protein
LLSYRRATLCRCLIVMLGWFVWIPRCKEPAVCCEVASQSTRWPMSGPPRATPSSPSMFTCRRDSPTALQMPCRREVLNSTGGLPRTRHVCQEQESALFPRHVGYFPISGTPSRSDLVALCSLFRVTSSPGILPILRPSLGTIRYPSHKQAPPPPLQEAHRIQC